jgi:hypothetical protein
LSLLARHAIAAKDLAGPRGEPAARDWAGELAATLAANESCAAAYRRVRAAFDLWYLREFAKGQHRHMPPWRALLLAWRSAREGRR